MDPEATRTPGSIRLKQNLGREAVNLALNGEWERATEVNKAILELFSDDVEAMNRLVKALIELGNYLDASAVLNQVCEVAPYNTIAKKNRARLDQLTADPESASTGFSKRTRKSAEAPQNFIEETGKSGTNPAEHQRKQGGAPPFSQRPRGPIPGQEYGYGSDVGRATIGSH